MTICGALLVDFLVAGFQFIGVCQFMIAIGQLNSIDNPFPRSQQVIEELQADRLLQEPALPDNPEREAEIEALRDKYNLPGAGMI